MFSRTEERISIAFILTGFALRAWLLLARGENYEVDQAVILYWGREYWRSGTPAIFGPEFTQWEMFASYLFGGLDLAGVNPQWAAFALSAVEVALTGWLARRLWGRSAALAAMALLALLPWHVFYSSIVGTCVAVGIWPLLLLGFRWPVVAGLGLRWLGLWHYSAFRVFLFAEFLWSALRRRWRELALPLGGFSLFLGATLWLQPELWRRVFFRGEYVFETPDYVWWEAIPRGLVFLLTPMAYVARGIADMEVGTALVEFTGAHGLPLSLAGTVLLGFGLFDAWKRRRRLDETEKFTLFFIAVAVVSVSFAASFTHLLFLLPFLALWMARGLLVFGGRRRVLVLVLTGGVLAATSALMADYFSRPDARDLFSRRIAGFARVLDAESPSLPPFQKYLLSSQGLIEGRYWMEKLGSFMVLSPMSADALETQIAGAAGVRRDVWILVDRFVDPVLDVAKFPEINAQNLLIEEFILHVKKNAQVLEERVIEAGAAQGLLLKIRWP